jgi:hypothetical protein
LTISLDYRVCYAKYAIPTFWRFRSFWTISMVTRRRVNHIIHSFSCTAFSSSMWQNDIDYGELISWKVNCASQLVVSLQPLDLYEAGYWSILQYREICNTIQETVHPIMMELYPLTSFRKNTSRCCWVG